jgi:hypothetical protein
MAEVGGPHLFAQEFKVDEAVEDAAAIVVGEVGKGAVAEQGFVAQSFVPIGLQNDAAVDDSDDAIDHLRGGSGGGGPRRGEKEEKK